MRKPNSKVVGVVEVREVEVLEVEVVVDGERCRGESRSSRIEMLRILFFFGLPTEDYICVSLLLYIPPVVRLATETYHVYHGKYVNLILFCNCEIFNLR